MLDDPNAKRASWVIPFNITPEFIGLGARVSTLMVSHGRVTRHAEMRAPISTARYLTIVIQFTDPKARKRSEFRRNSPKGRL